MPDYTTNFNLEKPLQNEYFNIDIQNGNMDIIDSELNNVSTRVGELAKIKTNITILSANWVDDTSASGFWIYDIADADITEDSSVDISLDLVSLENAEDIKSRSDSFAGYVRIYAYSKPSVNLAADIKITKGGQ